MVNTEKEDLSKLDQIDMKATGQRIKFLVKKAGFSQSELAKLLDRDSKTISNYYSGKSLPEKIDLLILSRVLGEPSDELLVLRGDLEGYQRIDNYVLEYRQYGDESLEDTIKRSKMESKLFNPDTKGASNIKSFEEAGYCLTFFRDVNQQDIKNRIIDELLSGGGVNSDYMKHIFEVYIWRKLTNEQKAVCETQFAIWRGERTE